MGFLKIFILINITSLIITLLYKKSIIPLFSFFIGFVVVFEVFISEWFKITYKTNQIAYGIFAVLCSIYYIFVYIHKVNINKIWQFICMVFWLLLIIVTFLYYKENKFVLLSKIYLMNYTLACILSIFYLKTKLINPNTGTSLWSDPYLPFTFGILIFYTSSFPLLLFLETLISSGNLMRTYSSFLNFSNIFLSLGYLGAIICTPKEAPSTTSS